MKTVVAAYENSIHFYFPKDEAVRGFAFWNRVDARLKDLCSDLAKELSGEYSVAITAEVGPGAPDSEINDSTKS